MWFEVDPKFAKYEPLARSLMSAYYDGDIPSGLPGDVDHIISSLCRTYYCFYKGMIREDGCFELLMNSLKKHDDYIAGIDQIIADHLKTKELDKKTV